jgi:hypothetical protein
MEEVLSKLVEKGLSELEETQDPIDLIFRRIAKETALQTIQELRRALSTLRSVAVSNREASARRKTLYPGIDFCETHRWDGQVTAYDHIDSIMNGWIDGIKIK